MSDVSKCTILGLGWLGLPLANALIEENFEIIGTTTTIDKSQSLNSNSSINSFVWNLSETAPLEFVELTKQSEIIIIAIPASKVFQNLENLTQFLKKVSKEIEIILCSTTGVYPDSLTDATEAYQFEEEDYSNRNVQIELKLSKELSQRLTVVRLAGLIGPNRHPVTMLSGRKNISDGNAPVNLVQLFDVVSFFRLLLQKNSFGEVYNLCYPLHPSRKEYYQACAIHLNLPLPEFENEGLKEKIISSEKVMNNLGFQFKHSIMFE